MNQNLIISFQLNTPVRRGPDCHQNGSIILIVLMLMVIMSTIGIASSNISVSENFIVRNAAIRKQNTQIVDAVAFEALQRVMDTAYMNNNTNLDPSDTNDGILPLNPTSLNWVIDKNIWASSGKLAEWYDPTHIGWVLTDNDELIDPGLDLDDVSEPIWETPSTLRRDSGAGIRDLLIARGDWTSGNSAADSPIRYALVGWSPAPGSSIKTTGNVPLKRTAEILTEYLSEDFGVMRLSVGLVRYF
jgi:hypothetical protein